jgi:ribose transport system substrate-binding protein
VTSIPRLSRSRAAAVLFLGALLTSALAAAGASGADSSKSNPKIAYLSFAVANSYDAPMLAAAKAVAKAQGASVVVFDAANDPKKQLAQLKTAITSKQYDGIVVQPIFGPQLIPTITQAVTAGMKIVNIDQILGANRLR